MEQAKALQEDFNNYLKTVQRRKKAEEQKKTLLNINRLLMGEMILSNLQKTMVQ